MMTLAPREWVVACVVFLLFAPTAAPGQEAEPRSIHAIESQAHRDFSPPASPLPFQPAPLPPEVKAGLTRTVFGFYPYWRTDWSEIRFGDLTHLAYFSLEADGNGNLTNLRGWPNGPMVDAAHRAGARVVVVCTLFSSSQLQLLLPNPTSRQHLIQNLRDQVLAGGADGVNIDFEGVPASQKGNLVLFMQELAVSMRASLPGAHISIDAPAVDWSASWDYRALAEICDALMIMCYDYHWSGGDPGPISPLQGSDVWGRYSVGWTVADYLTKVGAALSRKLVMGVPYYGYDWPAASSAFNAPRLANASAKIYSVTVSEAAQRGRRWDAFSATPWYFYTVATPHQVWYEDAPSLSLKYDLVFQNNLQGIGIWALTYDLGRTELWSLIEDRFGIPVAPSPPTVTAPSVFWETGGLPIAIEPRGTVAATGYEVAVGSSEGGTDVLPFKEVGLRRQVWLTGLQLQAGATYYITARGLGRDGVVGASAIPVAVRIDPSRPVERQYIPQWISSAALYTGLAAANAGSTAAAIRIRGRVRDRTGIVEASWVLAPGRQLARVVTHEELLGAEVAGKDGWIEVIAEPGKTVSMYLTGDTRVERSLAGGPLAAAAAAHILPELDGGKARIILVNPNAVAARATLSRSWGDGRVSTVTLGLAPGEIYVRTDGEIFSFSSAPIAAGNRTLEAPAVPWLRVDADRPILCTSLLARDGDSAALPALDPSTPLKRGGFAYAVTGDCYRSRIILVNPSAAGQSVECRFLGASRAAPVPLRLPGNAAVAIELETLFSLGQGGCGAPLTPGAVLVEVREGEGILGAVWTRSDDLRIMSTLPLDPVSASQFNFPQLAQSQGYWTGMNLANPGAEDAAVSLEAYDSSGASLGKKSLTLKPGESAAGLILQWIAGSLGVSSGRVEVRCRVPILAAEVFGADTLAFMASVPGRQ